MPQALFCKVRLPYFTKYISEFDPLTHIVYIVAVHEKSFSIVVYRQKLAGIGLLEFSDIRALAAGVDEDSCIAIAYRTSADQQYVILVVYRMQMIARDADTKMNGIAKSFAIF